MKKILMGLVVALGFTTPALAEYDRDVYSTAGVQAITWTGNEYTGDYNNDNATPENGSGCNVNADYAFTSMRNYWLMHSGISTYDDAQGIIDARTEAAGGEANMNAAVACWVEALIDDNNAEDLISAIEAISGYQDNSLHSGSHEQVVNAYISMDFVAVPYTLRDALNEYIGHDPEFDSIWEQANADTAGRVSLKNLVDEWNLLSSDQRNGDAASDIHSSVVDYLYADLSYFN